MSKWNMLAIAGTIDWARLYSLTGLLGFAGVRGIHTFLFHVRPIIPLRIGGLRG